MIEPLVAIAVFSALICAAAGFAVGRVSASLPQYHGVRTGRLP